MEIKDFNSELELKKESENLSEKKTDSVLKKQVSKREILTKRGLFSKTFQKKKGVFETEYYQAPIHLKDKSGVLVEMSKKIVEADDKQSFQNEQHEFKADFYKDNAGNALFTVSKNTQRVTVAVKKRFGESAKMPTPVLKKKNTEVCYADIAPETDYDFSIIPDGVKASLTIHKASLAQRFGFRFAYENVRCETESGLNYLKFLSDEDNTPVFIVPAPYMIDASGKYSERVSLVPVKAGDGTIDVDIVPEAGWLTEKDRAFPVRVEWFVQKQEANIPQIVFEPSSVSADGKLEVGKDAIPFRMVLPKTSENMIRKKIQLLLQCENVPVADDREFLLALNRVTENEENGSAETRLISASALNVMQNEYAFNVTSEETVAKSASYSLQLCEMSEGTMRPVEDFSAVLLNVSPASEAALFSVSETDGTSDQDGASGGESGNLGSVGTYEVDIVSGLLNMELKDFAWEGNRMPVSISHSFRGQYAKSPYLWGQAINPFAYMNIGAGWRLNLMQCMIPTGTYHEEDSPYDGRDTYTYFDETGEELIFAQCKCESGSATCTTYEDINGLGYTYDASTGIMKKGAEQYRFESHRLTRITNEYGDYMAIVYSEEKIDCVTDGVNRVFSFNYAEDNLIAIVAPNNAAVSFSYCNNRLCCATFPNGQTLSFDYHDENGLPTSVEVRGAGNAPLVTHFSLLIGDDEKAKVAGIHTNGSNRSVAFEYRNEKQTVITESETGEDGENNNIAHHRVYLHEHSDKNYSYYANDGESKIHVTGEHGIVVPYTEPGMEIGNLKCQNLLSDHNFNTSIDDLRSSQPVGAWRTNLRDNFVQHDPPEKMPGFCSAYLINWAKRYADDGIWQNVTLESGKNYVFSCYLKLVRANGSNKGVYLKVRSNNGGSEFISQKITIRKEFQRVALPFRVESGCGTSFSVGIYIDDYIQAKAIAPQLEEGAYLSPYNYLKTKAVTIAGNGPTCSSVQTIATVYVPTGKDAKETFTLSGYVAGEMSGDSNAALSAKIHYFQKLNENIEPEEIQMPVYSVSDAPTFFMFQFSKSLYRGIEKIEIVCTNNNNSTPLILTDLQLVRNSYADGLSEEDFAGTTATDDASDDTDTIDRVTDTAEEVETIVFEEVKDAFGNALTSTNFQNGEFGTIYGESKFDDTDQKNPLQDEGNNKTVEIDARGNATCYEYDPATSKPKKVIDRCGSSTHYSYDASGRTTGVLAANGGTIGYTYNAYDDLTKIERGDGQAYDMAYDPFRNLTGVQVDNQGLVSYTYRAGTNRLKTVIYANKQYQTLTYDRFGNVKAEVWNLMIGTEPAENDPVQAEYRYSYDASQNLVKTLDILNGKMYNVNRSGENIASVEEYNIGWNGSSAVDPVLVGTMFYSFDGNGKQFRKKYVPADGSQEQKYVFEFKDEQNVAVKLPTGAVSHAKSDHFGRKVFDELQLGKGFLNRTFTYHKGVVSNKHLETDKRVSDPTTTLVKEIKFADGRTIQYEYDNEERIISVVETYTVDNTPVTNTTLYTYDALGQLLTETKDGVAVNTMSYDLYGNITEKNGVPYTYGNSTWKDLLTSVGNQPIFYDANGNPTNYRDHALTWEKGRQLKQFGNYSYKYNNDGIRIEKVENCKTHKYILDGTNILKEIVTDNCCNCNGYVNEYLYDLDGTVCGLKHNETAYYFYKNLQGDVIAITNETGAVAARYSYDAWGKCKVESDTSGVGIANINPFRYRSYYYDSEIGMYYLQSRYYGPEVGRFINADNVENPVADGVILNWNSYAYCDNNPTNDTDISGTFGLITIAQKVIRGIFIGLLKVLFVDIIEHAFKLLILHKDTKFDLSPIDEYIVSVLSEIVDQFGINSEKVKLGLSIMGTVLKYARRIIFKSMKARDWINFVIDILGAVITYIIGKSLAKAKEKYDKILVPAKKQGSKNLSRKIAKKIKSDLYLSIRYKGIAIDFTLPISQQFLSSFFNIILDD